MIRKRKKEKVEFNTTALPDIVFMLLFFFMVVTVLKDDSDNWKIDLPTTEHTKLIQQQDQFLNIGMGIHDEKIVYRLENKKFLQIKNLKNGIEQLIKGGLNRSETKVKIKIDKMISMKEVNQVKTILQETELFTIEYIVDKNQS